MTVEENTVHTADGYKLSVAIHDAGSEDVAVWMHGITVDKDEYLGFFREGADYLFKKGVSSIRFDFRGHGKSQGSSGDFSIVGQSLDARAVIDLAIDRFGPKPRLHLVAASFGSPPAIFAAVRDATNVRSVTLIAPVLSYERTFLNPETEWAREIFSRDAVSALARGGQIFFDDTFCVGASLVEEMHLIRPTDFMSDLVQPVLVFHGDRDSMVPFLATRDACRRRRNVRLVALKGADHGFIEEGDDDGTSEKSERYKKEIFRGILEQVGLK